MNKVGLLIGFLFLLTATKCVYLGTSEYKAIGCGDRAIPWPSKFENEDYLLEKEIGAECTYSPAYKVTKKKCEKTGAEYCIHNIISIRQKHEQCVFEVIASFDDKGKDRIARYSSEVDGPIKNLLGSLGLTMVEGPSNVELLNHREQNEFCKSLK